MKHYRSQISLSRIAAGATLAAALLAPAVVSAAGYPVVVPASSKDNGSRSVVTIDQGNIYNQINNAYSSGAQAQATANGANGLAGAALNAANGANGAAARAQAAADATAAHPAGGFATPVVWVTATDDHTAPSYSVACIWGFPPVDFGASVTGHGAGIACPNGSGLTVFSEKPGIPKDSGGPGGGSASGTGSGSAE